MSSIDDTRMLIEECIGDVFCVKQQTPGGHWILTPPAAQAPGGIPVTGRVIVHVGWQGQVVVSIMKSRTAYACGVMNLAVADLPSAIASSMVIAVIEQALAAVASQSVGVL